MKRTTELLSSSVLPLVGQRSLLDFAISQGPAVLYIGSPQRGRPLQFIGSNVEALTGHAREDFLADPDFCRGQIHPDDLVAFDRNLKCLQERGPTALDYRFKTAEGNWLWLRDHQELREEDGREVVVGCLLDVTDEVRTRRQSHEDEAIRAAVIDASQNALIAFDAEGRILVFNSQAEKMFGTPRRVAIGSPLDRVIPHCAQDTPEPQDALGVACFKAVEAANGAFRTDAVRPDGTRVPIEVTARRSETGERSFFVLQILDISERVAAETEHQRLATLLQDAIDSMPTGFMILDADDRMVAANSALIRRYASDLDSIEGLPLREFVARLSTGLLRFDGEVVSQSQESIDRVTRRIREMTSESVEAQLANGEWRLKNCYPTSEGGKVIISIDLTKLKTAEIALRESEQHFRMLVERHPLPVWLVESESGKIIYASPAVEQLTGWTWSPGEERNVLDYYADPSDRDAVVEQLRRTGELWNHETKCRRADGTIITVSTTARLTLYRGKLVHIAGMIDLTEQRAREEEIKRAHETLEDAIESLSDGFVLFDAEQRLVMCNSQFRAYNKDTGAVLRPGVKWTDLLNAQIESGMLPAAEGRSDASLEDCMDQQPNACCNEIQTSDGRRFAQSCHRTRQGGLVATWRDVTERRKMEQALRESEALIRRVVEDNPLPIIMNRFEDGKILYESPASRKAFGVGLDEDAGSVIDRYVDRGQRDRLLEKLLEQGFVDSLEIDYQRADGSRFLGAVSCRLIDYHGDKVVVSSTIDLTERKKREDELRHARETLEDAIEALSEGLALYDAEDRLVMTNARYRELNAPNQEIFVPGAKWQDLIRARIERGQVPDWTGDVEAFIRDRMTAHKESRVEVFRMASGKWIETSYRMTRQNGLVTTWRDITRQRDADRALRESEAMLSNVLDACPLPVIMHRLEDDTEVFMYENTASKTLFGYATAGDLPYSALRWASSRDRRRSFATLRESGVLDGAEVELRRADGSTFWAAFFARLIEYQDEPVSVACIFDLTDRKQAEAEMARQREVIHQNEKLSALGEVLAGVAHELNNPLSVVVGQALLLKETAEDQRTMDRAEKISHAADRCSRIVKSFLAMARQEPDERCPYDINDIIDTALDITSYSLHASGIEVDFKPDLALPKVLADSVQLRQVLTNLIVNAQHALQAVERQRTLQIATSVERGGKTVRVEVRDNGCGIPKNIINRIFQPLFTTKEVGSGTGIGLAVSHRIIETHGGTITVQSEPGQGTVFTLRLPTATPNAEALSRSEEVSQSALRYRILVIDDEVSVADLLADILQRDGHEVVVAHSGREALHRIGNDDFDVILSDVRMPKLDGPSLFNALKNSGSGLTSRIGFITGDALGLGIKRFLSTSGRPYIEKPITPEDVRWLLSRIQENASP